MTPLRRKLALLGLAVFSYLVITELGLRIFWHNPYRRETPDHLLVLPIPHAGRHFIFDRSIITKDHTRVHVRVDDRGYILPSHQFDPSDVTIAFLGGSTTECFAVDEPLRFPALVSTLLAKRGLKVNTLNGGLSTNTIHDALNVLINHLVDDRPDVVIFMGAASDHGLLSRAGSYRARMGAPSTFASMMRWPLQKGSSVSYLVGILRVWGTISMDVQPIFDTRCIPCHNSKSFLDLTADNSYAGLVDAPTTPDCQKQVPDSVRVVAFDTQGSMLWLKTRPDDGRWRSSHALQDGGSRRVRPGGICDHRAMDTRRGSQQLSHPRLSRACEPE